MTAKGLPAAALSASVCASCATSSPSSDELCGSTRCGPSAGRLAQLAAPARPAQRPAQRGPGLGGGGDAGRHDAVLGGRHGDARLRRHRGRFLRGHRLAIGGGDGAGAGHGAAPPGSRRDGTRGGQAGPAQPGAASRRSMALVSLALFAVVAFYVARYGRVLHETGSLSETLRIIVYPWVYVVGLGCAGLTLALLVDFLRSVAALMAALRH